MPQKKQKNNWGTATKFWSKYTTDVQQPFSAQYIQQLPVKVKANKHVSVEPATTIKHFTPKIVPSNKTVQQPVYIKTGLMEFDLISCEGMYFYT